jgi:phosphoglycerate dehydrogenase-like enzyme
MIYLDEPTFKPDIDAKALYIHYRKVDLTQYDIDYLVCPCTGTDHIDFEYCKKNNIKVIHLDDKDWLYENIWATAEHTLYLMLCALKSNTDRQEGYNRELRGKKVGIIGYGRIGKQIDQMLTSLGCHTIINDKTIDCSISFDVMFRECDIITIHVPLTEETEGLITKELWKPFLENGNILVNVSRPQIIEGMFTGDFESVESGDIIFTTCHMAGYTYESRVKTDTYVFDKLRKEVE